MVHRLTSLDLSTPLLVVQHNYLHLHIELYHHQHILFYMYMCVQRVLYFHKRHVHDTYYTMENTNPESYMHSKLRHK